MNWVPCKHQIREDIDLITFKTDKFKTAVLKLSMVAPMKLSDKEAALFSLMINTLRGGTEKYPEKEDIIKRLNDLYDASCSIVGYVSGDNRILEISAEFLDDRFSSEESIFDGVVEIMKEMLLHPRGDCGGIFREEVIDREKRVICDKIKSEKNNSRDYAIRRCREIMCKGEPYGQMTEVSVLMGLKREELCEFYRNFLSEAKLTFSYVGAEDDNIILRKLKRAFFEMPRHTDVTVSPLVSYPVKEVKQIVEEMNIKQGVLTIGLRTATLLGDENAYVMPVFNNVFGGTFMSRLFKLLREKMSLCYYCSSDYVNTKAVMYVSCGIDVANFERVKNEILCQLELLKRSEVGEEELRIAKDLALKELCEINDYPSAIATYYYSRSIYDLSETIEEITNKIETVTAEEIMSMAKKVIPDTVFFLKGTKTDDDPEEEAFDE